MSKPLSKAGIEFDTREMLDQRFNEIGSNSKSGADLQQVGSKRQILQRPRDASRENIPPALGLA